MTSKIRRHHGYCDLHASRCFADVKSGRIAYFEKGQGAATLFVHGVPLNGYHWRHVIDRVQHRRRCIAIDLMGLRYTEIGPSQDVSFTAQARMIAEVLDALRIERVDLIGNDRGGAIAQIFAARASKECSSGITADFVVSNTRSSGVREIAHIVAAIGWHFFALRQHPGGLSLLSSC